PGMHRPSVPAGPDAREDDGGGRPRAAAVPLDGAQTDREGTLDTHVVSGFSRTRGGAVAKTSWFDDKAQHPILQERASKLETFTSALADGVVTRRELEGQEQRLMTAMKALEPELSDALHEKVTTVLVELSAYNVMRLLHELQTERARIAFSNA